MEIYKKMMGMLGDYLKKHEQLENRQCVICRRIVNVVDDHFIKCNFCGTQMHYACIAMWIGKHNACPVCYNNYTIPHGEVYDPAQIEQDHED